MAMLSPSTPHSISSFSIRCLTLGALGHSQYSREARAGSAPFSGKILGLSSPLPLDALRCYRPSRKSTAAAPLKRQDSNRPLSNFSSSHRFRGSGYTNLPLSISAIPRGRHTAINRSELEASGAEGLIRIGLEPVAPRGLHTLSVCWRVLYSPAQLREQLTFGSGSSFPTFTYESQIASKLRVLIGVLEG